MAATVELKAKLSMSADQFHKALERAEDRGKAFAKHTAAAINGKDGPSGALSKLGSTVASFTTGPLAAIGAAFTAAFAAKSIYGGIANVYDMGAALHRLSEQTGISVGGLAQMRAAFGEASVDSDNLGGTVNRLQKAIEKGGDAFSHMGLDVGKLGGMRPEQQFKAVGDAISQIPDPMDRAAAAMEIFGRTGGELLAVFNATAFGSIGGALSGKAKILSDNAEIFYQSSRALAKAGNIFKGFYVGLAGGLGSSILPMLQRIASMDLTGMGMKIGKALGGLLAPLTALFNSKDPFKYAILSLKIGLGEAVNFFQERIAVTLEKLSGMLSLAGMMGGEAGKTAATWQPLLNGIIAALKTPIDVKVTIDQRNAIGAVGQSGNVGVAGRSSMFASSGMQFRTSGPNMGQGMRFNNVFDETSGVNMGPQGASIAHDAGWGTSGLKTAGLLTGPAADKSFAEQRQRAMAAKNAAQGTTVNAPGVEAKLDALKTSFDNAVQ